MKRNILLGMSLCVLASLGGLPTAGMAQHVLLPQEPQERPVAEAQPDAKNEDAGAALDLNVPQPGAEPAAPVADAPVKPLMEGPLNEAFLSPAKDREPARVDKPPPPPIVERPAVDPPSPRAEWIGGYWEWDPARKDFVWVTGTWRVPPPGRFWVNGYWKRDEQGWYRVPGFWSDRKTDRIDYRKDGPPADHPDDEPGEAPEPDTFYVPGQYYPDGDGVVWKPGFWSRTQPGWSWVPAQWVRQPEGWTFQEGFWDRTLEDRGTLFAPALVAETSRNADTIYQPYTEVSPQSYGLLYGAFGRPNSDYDGYPGCYYSPTGRYYGYAQYGSLSPYYGYLDYPYCGTLGYPYLTSPLAYNSFGFGYPSIYGASYAYPNYGFGGYGLFGGLASNLTGLGLGYYGSAFPFNGLGYGLGYGGFGFPFGGLGFTGFGFPFGGLGFGGFGFPFFGGFGFPKVHRKYPFYPGGRSHFPGKQHWVGRGNGPGNRGPWINSPHSRVANVNPGANRPNMPLQRGGGARLGSSVLAPTHRRGILPPPSSSPFANPFHNEALANRRGAGAGAGAGPKGVANLVRPGWNPAFNGVKNPGLVRHTSARPAFANPGAELRRPGGNGAGLAGEGGLRRQGGLSGFPGAGNPNPNLSGAGPSHRRGLGANGLEGLGARGLNPPGGVNRPGGVAGLRPPNLGGGANALRQGGGDGPQALSPRLDAPGGRLGGPGPMLRNGPDGGGLPSFSNRGRPGGPGGGGFSAMTTRPPMGGIDGLGSSRGGFRGGIGTPNLGGGFRGGGIGPAGGGIRAGGGPMGGGFRGGGIGSMGGGFRGGGGMGGGFRGGGMGGGFGGGGMGGGFRGGGGMGGGRR